MAGINLYDYQLDALKRMHNGCILCGGVGSGKSRTALAYFYVKHGGEVNTEKYVPMDDVKIPNLYIITTARKRDTCEWEEELVPFLLSPTRTLNLYHNRVVIDSWNNIGKYEKANGRTVMENIVLVGFGGHAKSVIDSIERGGKYRIAGFTEAHKCPEYHGYSCLGTDDELDEIYRNTAKNEFLNVRNPFIDFLRYPDNFTNVEEL